MKKVLLWLGVFLFCALVAIADVPTITLTIPVDLIDRAKVKVQLMDELRASLWEDHEGILNLKREAHIQELAHKLRILE